MQIVGFNFKKISGERKNAITGKTEVKSNINIKSITQETLDMVKDKIPLKFDFIFDLNYTPNIAEIIYSGFVVVLLDRETSKEILKKWKSKKIPDDIRLPLFNFILAKCSIKALQLEEEFGLPAHIPLPRLQASQENNQKYAG